jgi:hypothetical protein
VVVSSQAIATGTGLFNGGVMASPVAASQMRKVWSSLTVTTRRLSELNAA